MNFISYLTLAVVAFVLPFGNAFGMNLPQKPSPAKKDTYDRILQIIRDSAAKRDAARNKGKAGMQKGKGDNKQVPIYQAVPPLTESTQELGRVGMNKGKMSSTQGAIYQTFPVGPESTQEFGTASTLSGTTMRTARGTSTMINGLPTEKFNTALQTEQFNTARQTEQLNTALQTGILPEFYTAQDEIEFLTALQDDIIVIPDDGNNQRRQGWLTWIKERIAWLRGNAS